MADGDRATGTQPGAAATPLADASADSLRPVILVVALGGTPTLHVMSGLLGPPGDSPRASASEFAATNPLLDAFNEAIGTGADLDDRRSHLIARYAFAVPSDEAIAAISRRSPRGVVELGAGTGYWAYVLEQVGVDVVAFDIAPAPDRQNRWFAGSRAWHSLQHGDHDVVGHHSDRTLLVVWPPKNAAWPATAVERYHDADGECLVYVGEGPGGRTGDDVFHALLGDFTTCLQCEYGSTTSPCVCNVEARWRRSATVTLPHWPGYLDDLHVYTRRADRARPRWRNWHRPQTRR